MNDRRSGGVARRWLALITLVALLLPGVGAATPPLALAATLPDDPPTVTAQALPTWQLNGVVWSSAVVGNTVYVTGQFSKARPPGAAPGSAGEVAAGNIFAFDITTGQPVDFPHTLNAQGLVIRPDPDGSRIYVGGDFTAVDGLARAHIAAFDTRTGALTDFNARTDGQVRAFAFVGDTVYAGGNFRSANGQPRALFAAYDADSSQLTGWAPAAGGGYVWAMVSPPGTGRVIAAGSFTTLNGVDAYGMGALDAASGATLEWRANARLRAAGVNGAIATLSTDGTAVYGAGYSYGSGAQFEGTFSADPANGAINWVNDCLGDTYDTFPQGGVLYSVGHEHDCTMAGGFPDTSPRSRWAEALAERTTPIGTITTKDAYGWDYVGLPYTGLQHWYPDLGFGSYTASRQAAWTVTGNDAYVVLAGEFPTVNGASQQALTRFGKRPGNAGTKPIHQAGANPVPVPTESGIVKVVFGAMWDRDSAVLEYDVFRNGGAKIATITRSDSEFWKLPTYTFTDAGLAPGSQVRYQIRARDADGNAQFSAWSPTVTVSATPASPYAGRVVSTGATHLWRLGEAGGPFLDSVGDAHAANAGQTAQVAGALTGEADAAVGGTASGKLTTVTPERAPGTLTVEAWVRTTSARGGRIVGFGNSATGTSASATTDRVLYLDNSGRPHFMIRDTAVRTVTSPRAVNDGSWHHLVATVDGAGLQLYVDGVRAARDQRFTQALASEGYWRIGADQTSGFANRPSDQGLVGSIDEVAVYPRALGAADLRALVEASGRTLPVVPTSADAYATAVVADAPHSYWRLNEVSGDALDASGNGASGAVAGTAVARGVAGAIEGDAAATFDGSTSAIVARDLWAVPGPYSAELWFRTTSTRGGKLVGFGNTASGLSSSYDRHVALRNDGRLSFGVSSGGQQLVTTPASYNDGAWHHLVATQGSTGMRLYVDGLLAGSNPTTGAASYSGYWRIGGDRVWTGSTSPYFAGSLDEVAIYPAALSEDSVRAHFEAAGRAAPNRPPTAAFVLTSSYLAVEVDGSSSTDPDGPVATWSWDFGDGTVAEGATAGHTYAAAGDYTVRLTVTDGEGLTHTTTRPVSVAPNQLPVAVVTASVDGNVVTLDGRGSADADGTIRAWSWELGDGETASGPTPTHSYTTPGAYEVRLTVTDDAGATASATTTVRVEQGPNQEPTASFVWSAQLGDAAFDGTASHDPDGALTAWEWDFGDGATATGATASHTYSAPGTYTATLTVTDGRGATASVSQPVVIEARPPLATDTFSRTLTSGWGSADAGGTWTPLSGAQRFSVRDGWGLVTVVTAGSGPGATLNSVSSTSTDVSVLLRIDKVATGGGQYVSLLGRHVTGVGSYSGKLRFLPDGSVSVQLVRTLGNAETVLTSTVLAGLTYTPGRTLAVRLQVTGDQTTSLRAKVWEQGSPEPADWVLLAQDATASLQGPGAVGITTYLSGSATNPPVVFSFDDLLVTTP